MSDYDYVNIINSIYLFCTFIRMNHLKHRRKLKITSKNKTSPFYSPPHRFTSYSTQDSRQNNRYQLSPEGKIFDEILQIKPFSILNKEQPIDNKLNHIVTIHKEKQEINAIIKQTIETKKNQRREVNLKQQCLQIIKKHSISKETHKKHLSHQRAPKSTLETYDDIQNEIATQLINQCRRQKKVFETTFSRLSKMIQKAEIQYIRKKGLDVDVNHIKKYGIKAINKKDRVCTQYKEQINQSFLQQRPKRLKTIFDKKDFHTWLRTSNKMINMNKIGEQMTQSSSQIKMNKIYSKNSNDFLYKRYFKKNNERKTILSSAVDAPEC